MITFENEILTPLFRNIEQFADRNAFCIADEFYTYRQLGERIDSLRAVIRENGLSNKIVGVVAKDTIDTYAAIFALWAEGSAYVILHSKWPKERIDEIIRQAELEAYLDDGELAMLDGKSPNDLSLAYIVFTSGSTGKPKGVMVGRDNVAAFADSFLTSDIDITEEDRILQCAELTFDWSVWWFLPSVLRGACCFTVPLDTIKYQYIGGLIDEYGLTIVPVVPSTLRYLQPYFEEIDFSTIRILILGAEGLNLSLVNSFRKYAPDARVYNFYGPTECTVVCAYYLIEDEHAPIPAKTYNGIVGIGRMMKNCKGIVLDEAGNELPVGEKGELCIASPQVTKGYWKDDERTDAAYFMYEYEGQTMRFYHSGDLVYRDADGDYMYVGRVDHQTKIQGFRVELSEVEFQAKNSLPRESQCEVVCLAFTNKQGFTELAMFIESESFETEPMLQYMRTKMPAYMIPTRIEFVPVFPINVNGKTDRNKLRELL